MAHDFPPAQGRLPLLRHGRHQSEVNPGVYHFKAGMGGIECRQLGRYERAPSAWHRRVLGLDKILPTAVAAKAQPIEDVKAWITV